MKKLLLFFLCFISLGCTRSLVKLKGHLMNKIYGVKYYSNGERSIAFIGVVHINSPDYFEKVAQDIDSLRNAGYLIFYEGIKTNMKVSPEQKTELQKKLRSITGFHLSSYKDSTNGDMKKFNVKGYVSQTMANTGIDTIRDVNADYNLKTLIEAYEAEKGEVKLSECDLKTPIGRKYKCKKVDKESYDFLSITIRDRLVIKMIQESKAKKIAVLYGQLHKYSFERKLFAADTTMKFIKYVVPAPEKKNK